MPQVTVPMNDWEAKEALQKRGVIVPIGYLYGLSAEDLQLMVDHADELPASGAFIEFKQALGDLRLRYPSIKPFISGVTAR